VTYAQQSGIDQNGVGGRHLLDSQLWLVKTVGKGDVYASIRPIIDRIFQLLHEQGGVTVNGVHIGRATREQVIPQGAEYVGGERFFYSNQQFRIEGYPL
jgi:hypothetical protein